MDHSEFFGLTEYLTLLYEERFPSLTTAMAKIWYEEVKHLSEELVSDAIRRWARHHTALAPSLDQILEQVEIVREEQSRTRRAGSSDKSFLDVLRDAAEAQARNPERSEDDATFGHFMATLGERSVASWVDDTGVVHEKLNLEGRATQCYEWAREHQTKHPKLAEDLQYTARIYAQMRWDEEQGEQP